MQKFIGDSIELLNSKRPELEKVRLKIENNFKDLLINNEKNCLVQGRVKDSNSLAEKIIRKNYFGIYNGNTENFIEELNDIIGIRIVCVLQKEEKELHEFFKGIAEPNDDGEEGEWVTPDGILYINFKDQPEIQKNNHIIYKYSCKWVDNDENEYNVELQIKSLIHMLWGEIEHMIMYKNYGYLIDKDFYTNIMDSTFKILDAIDDQLLAMTGHLKRGLDDDIQKLVESREILAKLIFDSCQKNIEASLQSKVDLREVYEALAVILTFKSNSSLEIIKVAERYIGSAANYNLTFEKILEDEKFKLDSRNIAISRHDDISNLIQEIDKIVSQPDLFWRILIDMVRYLKLGEVEYARNENSYTEILVEIVNDLYNNFYEQFRKIDNTTLFSFIEKVTIKALIYTIKVCKKVTFIYNQELLISIFNETLEEIQEQENPEIPIDYSNENYIEYFARYLSALYLRKLDVKIPYEDLVILHSLHGQQESGYAKAYNAEEFENFMDSKDKVTEKWLEEIFNKRNEV